MMTQNLPKHLSNLTSDQLKVAQHKEGAALVLAPAGSGKSTTVLARVGELRASGVPSGFILLTTFSKKSVEDLAERAEKLGLEVNVRTLHSIGYEIFRKGCRQEHKQVILKRFSGNSYKPVHYKPLMGSYRLMKETIEELQKKNKGDKDFKQDPKHMLSIVSNCKKELLYPTEANKQHILQFIEPSTSMHEAFFELYKAYETKKTKGLSVDFDDMVALGTCCLDDSDRYYEHIMVDEAQDINTMQYTLVNKLLKNDNIMYVGDDFQSIYGFTGAIPDVTFGSFKDNHPDGSVYILRHNFRSGENIIEVSRQVASTMHNPYKKTILCGNTSLESEVSTALCGFPREEAEYVVDQIEQGVNTAILYRINSQSRQFEDFLLRRNIPYTIVGDVSFYARKEVLLLSSMMRVLTDPNKDNKALARVINIPSPDHGNTTRFLGKQFLQDMADKLKLTSGRSLYEVIVGRKHSPRKQKGVDDIKHMVEKYSKKPEETLPAFIERIMKDFVLPCVTGVGSGNADAVEESVKNEAESRLIGVEEQLVALAEEYAPDDNVETLLSYLDNMRRAALEAVQHDISDPNVVKLMTIHKSKGTEYDTVFVTGTHLTSLPFKWQPCKTDGMTTEFYESLVEEQRLFYVAITRPKTRLVITASKLNTRGWRVSENPWVSLEEVQINA